MQKNPTLRPAIATGLLPMVPLVMSILARHKAAGDGRHWSPFGFVVMGLLLFGARLAHELHARRLRQPIHRLALGVAILFAVFATWMELAVDGVSQLVHWILG